MTEIGRLLVVCGAGLLVLGGCLWALGRLGFRGLPGDIHYHSGNLHLYFPLASCLLLSLLLTVALWLWQWSARR